MSKEKRKWEDSYTTTTTTGEDSFTINMPKKTTAVEYINSPIEIEIPNSNYQQGWVCPKCGCVNAPWVESCSCQMPTHVTTKWYSNIPSYCQTCPNHPSNGGSGICHCTLGSSQVTCNTDSK